MLSVAAPSSIPLNRFLQEPLDRTEWMSADHLVEKQAMTAKTGRIQARLARYWGNYQESSEQGGEVYTETHCQTAGRVRCPDVAYLPPDLVQQYGDFKVLPQSFPLIAEIISPTDEMEAVFRKVQEYLVSGCQEVWLILPESQWVLLVTADQQQLRGLQDEAQTLKALPGFKVNVQTLLA